MEGPSSRLNVADAGPRKLATRRGSGGDSDPDAAGDVKTHFRVCRFMMETGTGPNRRPPRSHLRVPLLYFKSTRVFARVGCSCVLRYNRGCVCWCVDACVGVLKRLCCVARGEAGHALGARGHRVRAVPPLLPAGQRAGLRALPGGHELLVPGWQDRGAAHQDS